MAQQWQPSFATCHTTESGSVWRKRIPVLLEEEASNHDHFRKLLILVAITLWVHTLRTLYWKSSPLPKAVPPARYIFYPSTSTSSQQKRKLLFKKKKNKNSSKPQQTVLPTPSWQSAGGHLEMPAGLLQVLMACSDPWIHSTRTALRHFCLSTISKSQTYAQKDKTKAWKRAQVMQRDEH